MPSNYDTRNPRGQQRNKLSREAFRLELGAFVESNIEALVNALVHIAVVDAHIPNSIRVRAKKLLLALGTRPPDQGNRAATDRS